jgi:hypothetical protein
MAKEFKRRGAAKYVLGKPVAKHSGIREHCLALSLVSKLQSDQAVCQIPQVTKL